MFFVLSFTTVDAGPNAHLPRTSIWPQAWTCRRVLGGGADSYDRGTPVHTDTQVFTVPSFSKPRFSFRQGVESIRAVGVAHGQHHDWGRRAPGTANNIFI